MQPQGDSQLISNEAVDRWLFHALDGVVEHTFLQKVCAGVKKRCESAITRVCAERSSVSGDSTVEGVRAKLLERSKLGLAKYGTTVAGNALPQHEWLRHAQEEVLDLAVYLQRIIDDPSANDNLFKVARKHCVENQRLKTEVKSLSRQLAVMKDALEEFAKETESVPCDDPQCGDSTWDHACTAGRRKPTKRAEKAIAALSSFPAAAEELLKAEQKLEE